MDFKLNEINAPQYVNFDSDSFHRDMEGSSLLTEDSLDDSKQKEYDDSLEQYLSSSQLSVEMKNTRNKYCDMVQSEGGESIMDATNEGLSSTLTSEGSEFMDVKENFPVQKNTIVMTKVKPAQNKRTVPEPFQFATTDRLKSRHTDACVNYKEQDFKSQLRQNSVLQSKKSKITKVEPFHFTESKKRKRVDNDFKSLAEQVSAFQNKTPQRYHTSHKGFEPREHWEPPHLSAKSPNLQALKRRRVVTALSKEQQEEKEIEEMKKYEFHARPVDPKIYSHASTDKRKFKAMIKTKNFYLKTAQRALQHKRHSLEKEYKFRARPVPSSILKGPTGLKEKPVLRTTAPITPKFESENRIEKRKQMQVHKDEVKTLPEKKVPKHSFQCEPPPVVPWTKRRTDICPFSFDTADKERFLQKEKRIQEEIENEKKAHMFHAQLMPYPSQPALPSVPKKPPTKVQPFNFRLSERNPKNFSFSSERNITFKAQPANVLKKEPFVPEKSAKQPIEILEFSLHTDRRASERQQLRLLKEAEEQEKEQMRQIQKVEEERIQQEELRKLRQERVHKANPIRQYKPVDVKPSSLPLTTPQPPNFETEKRIQARH